MTDKKAKVENVGVIPVQIVRLITGEILMGKVETQKNGDVSITDPYRVFLQQNPETGQPQLGIDIYIPFANDKTYTFKAAHILFVLSDVDDGLEDAYHRATSPIALPSGAGKFQLTDESGNPVK